MVNKTRKAYTPDDINHSEKYILGLPFMFILRLPLWAVHSDIEPQYDVYVYGWLRIGFHSIREFSLV